MKYNVVLGERLSALGFGAMRLPTVDGKGGGAIDQEETDRIIKYAYDNGLNYFDTAYMYHDGESERALGRSLSRFPRESYYLASKFPGNEVKRSSAQAIFEEQLEKCRVDYFDFYLLHNVSENSLNAFTDPQWGVMDYLLAQKRNGRIRHLGLSSHARLDVLKRFLDEYGSHMEFCQIQLNYLDWALQKAESKYNMLTERNIPVWVMEPVRGGRLASMTPEREAALKAECPDKSIASWCFRFLMTLPNVYMTLSGMSSMEQVVDNIKTYDEYSPLNKRQADMLGKLAIELMDLLPCTGCRYCTEGCPSGLDIPKLMELYNECRFSPSFSAAVAAQNLPEDKRPSACVACGNCKAACPQGIDVPAAIEAFSGIIKRMLG